MADKAGPNDEESDTAILGQRQVELTWPHASVAPWGGRRINDQSVGYRARRDSAGAPLEGLGVRKRAPAVSL